jgi:hypothetical protein
VLGRFHTAPQLSLLGDILAAPGSRLLTVDHEQPDAALLLLLWGLGRANILTSVASQEGLGQSQLISQNGRRGARR